MNWIQEGYVVGGEVEVVNHHPHQADTRYRGTVLSVGRKLLTVRLTHVGEPLEPMMTSRVLIFKGRPVTRSERVGIYELLPSREAKSKTKDIEQLKKELIQMIETLPPEGVDELITVIKAYQGDKT